MVYLLPLPRFAETIRLASGREARGIGDVARRRGLKASRLALLCLINLSYGDRVPGSLLARKLCAAESDLFSTGKNRSGECKELVDFLVGVESTDVRARSVFERVGLDLILDRGSVNDGKLIGLLGLSDGPSNRRLFGSMVDSF